MKTKSEITLNLPKEINMEGKTKLDIPGESETFYGTHFKYIICFTGDAVTRVTGAPTPDVHAKIKPLRLIINKRHKVLFAKVGPEKVEFINGKSKAPRRMVVSFLNTEPELEQLIFDLSRM